jgi:hypothetical protein
MLGAELRQNAPTTLRYPGWLVTFNLSSWVWV